MLSWLHGRDSNGTLGRLFYPRLLAPQKAVSSISLLD